MSEEQEMSELDAYYERSRRPLFTIPKHPLGRLGCGILIVGWFLIMLLPCAMIYIAFGYNITIPNGNIPEPEQHPALELQLVMESRNRGILFRSSNIANETNEQLCIENSVTYLLWESDSSATNSLYCQCYLRENENADWQYSEQYDGSCRP